MPENRMNYELTPCEVCGKPLSKGDPGNWWELRLKDRTVTIPLHDAECRSDWFMRHSIYSFRKDKRIEDVI